MGAQLTRGERVCAFIERYIIVPEGTLIGRLMVLEPFEREWILAVYDNPQTTSRAILSMAKKNGKTGLIAAIALCHVVGPEAVQNSQIVCGAMSRDQASVLFDYAAKMVRASSKLTARVHLVPSRKRMYGLARNVEFRVLSRDAKRTQGISPLVAIVDEAGQIEGPRSDFVDAIVTAQGAYDEALLFMISTQAATDSDYFSVVIDSARSDDDPHTVCHVHEAPKDCAVDDRDAWRAANPALGVFRSLRDMEKLAREAKNVPSFAPVFRNLNLNQRVETSDPAFPRDVWKACGDALVPHDGQCEVYAALDLSAVNDLTALVAVWRASDRWNVTCRFWLPEAGLHDKVRRDKAPYDVWADKGLLSLTPGPTVDYDYVAKQFLEMAEGWNLKAVAFDRWRIEQFKSALARQDAAKGTVDLFRPFGQGYVSMSPALDALESALLKGEIAHANHPVLAYCAANARFVRDEAGNRKLDKRNAIRRIDGVVALTMAVGVATELTRPVEAQDLQLVFLGGK